MTIGISIGWPARASNSGPGAERTRAEQHSRDFVPNGTGYPNLMPTYDEAARQAVAAEAFKRATDQLTAAAAAPSPAPPTPRSATNVPREAAAGEAMRNRIAAIMETTRRQYREHGLRECETLRQRINGVRTSTPVDQHASHELLDFADVLTDTASQTYADDAPDEANRSLGLAKACVDLATDFMPGVSLAKDVVSLASGKNVITGEELTRVDQGFLIAGLLMPGVLKNGIKHLAKVGDALRKLITRGAKSAPKAARLLQAVAAAEQVATHYGPHVEQAFASPTVQAIARKWGTSTSGLNQLQIGRAHV